MLHRDALAVLRGAGLEVLEHLVRVELIGVAIVDVALVVRIDDHDPLAAAELRHHDCDRAFRRTAALADQLLRGRLLEQPHALRHLDLGVVAEVVELGTVDLRKLGERIGRASALPSPALPSALRVGAGGAAAFFAGSFFVACVLSLPANAVVETTAIANTRVHDVHRIG